MVTFFFNLRCVSVLLIGPAASVIDLLLTIEGESFLLGVLFGLLSFRFFP